MKLNTNIAAQPLQIVGLFDEDFVHRIRRIPIQIFEMVQSNSYSFFFESLQRLNVNGLRISEIAIKLPARTYGHSKMKFKDIMHSVLFMWRLGWRTRLRRASLIYAAPNAGRGTGQAQAKWGLAPEDREILVRRV